MSFSNPFNLHRISQQIGLSSANANSTNRSDTAGCLSKGRLSSTTPLDTPCPTATIFDLCKTTNDASFHKKRKAKSKTKEPIDGDAAAAGSGEGVGTGNRSSTAEATSSATDRQKAVPPRAR